MQRIVNELTADGLVEAIANPAHKRSSLIALTATGRQQLGEMCERESQLLQGIEFDVSQEELEQAAMTLRRVRSQFEGPLWQGRVGAAEESEL
jgi:DNA-binding MarR family transcriptional regulator